VRSWGLLLVFPLVLLERGTVGYTIAVIDGLLVLGCLCTLRADVLVLREAGDELENAGRGRDHV